MPELTDKEIKLWRLALNGAASAGEIHNAATALVQSLRNRGVSPEEIESAFKNGNGALSVKPPKYWRPDYGLVVFPFGKKHKGEQLKDIPPDYLRYQLKWIRSDPSVETKFGDLADSIESFLAQ